MSPPAPHLVRSIGARGQQLHALGCIATSCSSQQLLVELRLGGIVQACLQLAVLIIGRRVAAAERRCRHGSATSAERETGGWRSKSKWKTQCQWRVSGWVRCN